MRIIWSAPSLADIDSIHAYIAQHDPPAAERVFKVIGETAERLLVFPRSGPPGRIPGTRQIVVPGTPYLMPYLVEPDRIVILRVLHGRQDWPDTGP